MSSIYLSQTQRFKFYVVKKSVSNLSINMHTYGGANFVPMAVPEICCFIFESNSKKLFFRTNLAICRRSSVAILLSSRSFNLANNASSPSACGILGYKPTTSVVTNIAFSGNLPRSFSFLKKIAAILYVRFSRLHSRFKMIIQKFRNFFRSCTTVRNDWTTGNTL